MLLQNWRDWTPKNGLPIVLTNMPTGDIILNVRALFFG